MKPVIAAILFLLTGVTVQAQYRELVGRPYPRRLDAIDRLYGSVIAEEMPAGDVADTLKGMRALAEELDDEELLLEADLLEASYDLEVGAGSLEKMQQTLDKATEAGISHVVYRAVWCIGQYYWMQEKYEQGFRWYMRLDDMMRNVDVADFPNKAIYLEEIGRAYYRFGDYEQAIPYFKTVAALPASDFYLPSWRHAINTMGLTYRQLGLLDQSDSCFRQLITHATDVSEQWVGIASGNLGYNEYLRGNYDDAVPLFEKDIRIAEQYDDPGLAAGSAMPLADVLLQRGQVAAAKASLDKAYAYIQESRQYDRLREWYPIMSKWYTAVGQQQVAAQYLDSALEANKRYAEKFNALKLMRANQEIMASRQEAALERLHAEAARQRVRRNAIIAGLVLAAFAILVLYGITVYRNRIRRKLQESELKRAHHELDSARRLLEGYASRILSNARIIQSMEGTEPERDDPALQQLRTATILTDTDWIDFRTQFQKVYPGITERLTEQHPDLTPAELRYLFLLKLELSNHEIAHALGISPASLRVTWHRIRKKIGLSASFTPPMFYTDYFVGN